MSLLTVGSGFDGFISLFDQNLTNPIDFLENDSAQGAHFSQFLSDKESLATLAKNTATEVILQGAGYFVVVDGSGLAASHGTGDATFSNYFSDSTGTITGAKIYLGGTVSGGVHSGGTLVASGTFTASSDTITVGESKVELDGSNLPTTFASWQTLANFDYTGSAVGISDVKYFENGTQTSEVTLPTSPLFAAINDYQALEKLGGDILSGPFTPEQLSTTQLVFSSGNGFLVIQGTGLGYTGSLSDPLDFNDLSGVTTSATLYQGGSYNSKTHVVDDGTVAAHMTMTASKIAITAGNFEADIDGTNLPTHFETWLNILSNDYTGPAIGLTDIKLLEDGSQAGSITLNSTQFTASFLGYKITVSGSFQTSLTSAEINAGSLPNFTATGVTVTQVSNNATVLNVSGLSTPVNLFDPGALNDLLSSVTAVTAAGDTAGVTLTLKPSGGAGIDGFQFGAHTPIHSLTGGSGNDTLNLGSFLIASDKIDGGAGTDTALLTGNYSTTPLVFNATTMVNVETLKLGAGFNYKLTTNDATVASTQTLTVNASALAAANSLTFNGTAETNGHFTITGGAGNDVLTGGALGDTFNLSSGGNDTVSAGGSNDTINMGAALTASDKIDGGAGTDIVNLAGNYAAGLTFGATTMVNVETLKLGAGFSYKLTTNDATVASGQTLVVSASALAAANSLTFNGAAETNGHFTLTGGAGNDVLTGGALADTFNLTLGGNDTVTAGAGNDIINMGAALTASDKIDGGTGTDTVNLAGNYATTPLVFGATTMINVETLNLGAGFNYKLTTNDATVASTQTLTVNASALAAANSLTFNGTAETNGHFTITGGAGNDVLTGGALGDTFNLSSGGNDTVSAGGSNDTINMGAALTASDKIDGGAGTDIVNLAGNYAAGLTFGATTMVNVETLKLGAGFSYKLTTNDATVASGQTLVVSASALAAANSLTFNGAAETNGHFKITGGLGADTLTGGALSDTFVYTSAEQSSSTHYDTINAFNFSLDRFDIPGTITAIDTAVSHALSAATFNTDLAAAVSGHLNPHTAMLVTASGGSLSGQTFLVVDLDGSAGYTANADLVIHLSGQTATLATTDFI